MPQKRGSGKGSSSGLWFITDVSLRTKIEGAIETISFLYLFGKKFEASSGVAKEIRRVIILYSASIIEAALLFIYKRKGFAMEKLNYTNVYPLPKEYQFESNSVLVLAKQISKSKQDRDLMLDSLLKFFSDKRIIKTSLKERIDRVRNVRNTFHLSKSRKGVQCGVTSVTSSLRAAVNTILAVEAYLEKNR